MQTYGWSEEHVRKRITGAKGWAYYFWATAQSTASMMQNPLDPDKGYGWQEIERRKNGR